MLCFPGIRMIRFNITKYKNLRKPAIGPRLFASGAAQWLILLRTEIERKDAPVLLWLWFH